MAKRDSIVDRTRDAVDKATLFKAKDSIRDGHLINATEVIFFLASVRVGAELWKKGHEAYTNLMGNMLMTGFSGVVTGKGDKDAPWYRGSWLIAQWEESSNFWGNLLSGKGLT